MNVTGQCGYSFPPLPLSLYPSQSFCTTSTPHHAHTYMMLYLTITTHNPLPPPTAAVYYGLYPNASFPWAILHLNPRLLVNINSDRAPMERPCATGGRGFDWLRLIGRHGTRTPQYIFKQPGTSDTYCRTSDCSNDKLGNDVRQRKVRQRWMRQR